MYEIDQTDLYRRWFAELADERARARIDMRIFPCRSETLAT
ncbi:hypothetical protein [Kaistia algarum]|nr:hypothetical protein [Kaistia algarum]